MKKIEITKFGPFSVFKAMIYMMIIPIVFLMLIGLAMTLIGVVTQSYELIGMGIFIAIGYPVIFIVMYGLFGTLMTLVYNVLAGKFGGLEVTIKDTDEYRNITANAVDKQ